MKLICRNCRAEFDDEDGIFCPICGTKNGVSEEGYAENDNDSGNSAQISSESVKMKSSEETEKILQDIQFYYQQSEEKKEGTKENPNADYYERGITLARRHLSDVNDYRIWWEAAKPIDFWNTEESDLSDKSDIDKVFFDKALDLANMEEKKKLISEVDAYHQRKKEKRQKEEARLLAEQQQAEEEERRRQEEEWKKQEEERLLAEQKRAEEERLRLEEKQRKEKERLEAEKRARAAREEAERIAAIEEDKRNRTVNGVEYGTLEEANVAKENYKKLQAANGSAIVSLVCGILSLVGCIIIIPAIPLLIIGIIFGIKALKQETTNIGRAVAGMITSIVSLIIVVVVVVVVFSNAPETKNAIPKNETTTEVSEVEEPVETGKTVETETEKIDNVEPATEAEKASEGTRTNVTNYVAEEPLVVEEVAETDTSEYLLPEADTRYYSREELEQLGYDKLKFARNEILARHGRIFEAEDLNAYYSSKSWYQPQYTSDQFDPQMDQILNAYEKANIEEIKKIENEEGKPCLYRVTVNGTDGSANLRDGAGTSYNVIKTIINGVVLNVYAESSDGNWLQTEYQGSSGWVASSQVQK